MGIMRIEKENLDERRFTMDMEQEVIDTYYDALEVGGPEEAIYVTQDLTGYDVAQIEQILMKSGILESIQEEEDKKKDDEKEKKDDDKKDDEEEMDESVYTVEEEFTIPGTDIILEKGDKFKVIEAENTLGKVMKKVSAGEELSKEDKEIISVAVDTVKGEAKGEIEDIMKKVSAGKELSKDEQKKLSAAIDASK